MTAVKKYFNLSRKSFKVLSLSGECKLFSARRATLDAGSRGRAIFDFLLFLSSAVFVVIFSAVNIAKYNVFYSSVFGWPYIHLYPKLARGVSILSAWVLPEYAVISYILSPVNYFLALIYGMFPHPQVLFVFQALIMAAGVIPVYLLARLLVKNDFFAFAVSMAYLLHPIVTSGAMLGFISYALPMPFFLFSFLYLEKRDFMKFVICIILANTGKIDAVFMGLIYGALLCFSGDDKKKYGKIILKINSVWIITASLLCFVYLGASGKHFPMGILHFDKYGNTLSDTLNYVARKPLFIFGNLFNENNMLASIFLGLPAIFVLLSPLFLIPVIPEAIFILVRNQHSSGHFFILAFVFAGGIYGSVRLLSYIQRLAEKKAKAGVLKGNPACVILGSIILIFSLARHYYVQPKCCFNLGPVPLTKNFSLKLLTPTPHTVKIRQFLNKVPSEATCLTSQSLAPHLGRLKMMAIFSREVLAANYDWDYILLDITGVSNGDLYHISKEDFFSVLKDFISSRNYGVQDFSDGLILLRKGWSKNRNSEAIKIIDAYTDDD